MKKAISILLVLLMAATLFAGCAKPAEEAPAPEAPVEKAGYTIGISFATYGDYQVEWEKYAKAYAEERGATIVTTSADGKIEKQVSDVESLLVQKPDALMLWAIDSDAMVPSVESIYNTDIACIIASYGVNTDQYDLYLYADQILTGNMQAEYCNQWVTDHPGEALKCGYIWGNTGISGCIDRYNGWYDACVATNDSIELLDEQIGNWATADAMAITEDWLLAYPEMNCIVCMNDEMALGVIQALQAANVDLDKFVVLGIDGSETAQQELAKGTLDGTVFENRRLAAEIQIQCVLDYLDGKPFESKDYLVKCKQMMTPDNMEEILANLA